MILKCLQRKRSSVFIWQWSERERKRKSKIVQAILQIRHIMQKVRSSTKHMQKKEFFHWRKKMRQTLSHSASLVLKKNCRIIVHSLLFLFFIFPFSHRIDKTGVTAARSNITENTLLPNGVKTVKEFSTLSQMLTTAERSWRTERTRSSAASLATPERRRSDTES